MRGKYFEQRKLVDISLISPHSITKDEISEYFYTIESITILNTKYEMLDTIPNNHHMIRALCALYLGNNTNPSGISVLGPLSLIKQMIKIHKDGKDTTVESTINNIHQ